MEHLGRRQTDADYGLGEHTIDVDRLGLVDEEELTGRLVRVFQAPGYRPPRLPAVAMELLSLSQDPDVEFDDIEKLLEQDSVLAGEVLAGARSAAHAGRGQPVGSVRGALMRLGLDRLRELVLEAAMNQRVFRSKCYRGCMERVQSHSRATAHLSRVVSHHSPIAEEHAFLCGLLHDVGIAGILLVLGDVERGKKPPDLLPLWPAIDRAHAQAGARMVELWGLPQDTAMAVGAHHQVSIGGFDHPVAATICLAESLSAELDLGLIPASPDAIDGGEADVAGLVAHGRVDRSEHATVARARAALRLSDATLDSIRADARTWANAATADGDGD